MPTAQYEPTATADEIRLQLSTVDLPSRVRRANSSREMRSRRCTSGSCTTPYDRRRQSALGGSSAERPQPCVPIMAGSEGFCYSMIGCGF
jgi:hypothetical protein